MDTFGVFDIVIGFDVGKTGHHAGALTADGEKIHNQALPQTESDLRALFDSHLKQGSVLMVVDQPSTIGALPVAVARDCGATVAYLPGLAMRKAGDLYPRTSQNRPQRRLHHRRHRSHDAAHPAHGRPQ